MPVSHNDYSNLCHVHPSTALCKLAMHTLGGVATPAQQVMTIVPADSTFEVEAMVANRDIGFVTAGQEAQIKIDTFSFTKCGLVRGELVNVSHDAIVREKPLDKSNPSHTQAALSETSEPQGQEFVYAARVPLDAAKARGRRAKRRSRTRYGSISFIFGLAFSPCGFQLSELPLG